MTDAGRAVSMLWNARVVDGTGAPVRTRAIVQIADGRIAGIGEAADADAPEGALDLGGRTVLPGLNDAHYHVSPDTEGLGIQGARGGELPRRPELAQYALAK